MDPVKFNNVNITYGEGQEEFRPLPAFRVNNKQAEVITKWKLTDEEIKEIARTGHLYLSQATYGNMFQAQLPMAFTPIMLRMVIPAEIVSSAHELREYLREGMSFFNEVEYGSAPYVTIQTINKSGVIFYYGDTLPHYSELRCIGFDEFSVKLTEWEGDWIVLFSDPEQE